MKKECDFSKVVRGKFCHSNIKMELPALEAEDYPEARAKRGSLSKLQKLLANAPDVEPESFDKL